jgi:hypothetical protein
MAMRPMINLMNKNGEFVGAHGNAPDDQFDTKSGLVIRNPAIESQCSDERNCLDRL